MRIDIDDSNNFMILGSDYQQELDVITESLTTEMPNAWMLKKMGSVKITGRKFVSDYGTVPIGLWVLVLSICKKYNISVQLSDRMSQYINQFQLDFDEFKSYVDTLFRGARNEKGKPFKPYDYQVTAAYMLLKYKKCCGELSTSAGKTLISFIIFKYLFDVQKVKKILYVVPSVDLAEQSAVQYERYETYLKKHNHNWSVGILRGGLSKKEKEKVESANILFGTFQSLCKKDHTFFVDFNACINDECHHSSNTSIKNVLTKCNNLIYSIGVTGTFPKEHTYENMIIQSYIGPLVHKFTADELINKEKRGTPIYVTFQYLNWGTQAEKRNLWLMRSNKDESDIGAGAKVLKEEQKVVNSSYTRLKYIAELAIKTKKNTLVLFGDVKGGYGKRIYEYIKDNSDKTVFYVDGNTKSENREWMKEQMEEDLDGNTVMVASIGTMGEGIDLKNLWCIFLVNTAKSERIIRQICGRGLRLFEGKTKVVLIDFVDDLRYSENGHYNNNYMWKHYTERRKIYLEQKFPVYEQKIDFDNQNSLI